MSTDENGGPDGEGDYTDKGREWLRRAGQQERPGIPLHKLGSNDDWHVTDLEIRGALHTNTIATCIQLTQNESRTSIASAADDPERSRTIVIVV